MRVANYPNCILPRHWLWLKSIKIPYDIVFTTWTNDLTFDRFGKLIHVAIYLYNSLDFLLMSTKEKKLVAASDTT